MRARRGFSLIELLTVMLIIGILARIAVPHYADMKRRATAAAIMGDVHAIRIAAFTYYAESGTFPGNTAKGRIPPELLQHLPANFEFRQTDYTYQWHVWTVKSGPKGHKTTETLVGVAVTTKDPALAAQLLKMAGPGFVPVATSSKVTFLLGSDS